MGAAIKLTDCLQGGVPGPVYELDRLAEFIARHRARLDDLQLALKYGRAAEAARESVREARLLAEARRARAFLLVQSHLRGANW